MTTHKISNVEVYEYTQPIQYCRGPHTDNTRALFTNYMGGMSRNDWLMVARAKKAGRVAYDSVMDYEEYSATLLANCCDEGTEEEYELTRVIVLEREG